MKEIYRFWIDHNLYLIKAINNSFDWQTIVYDTYKCYVCIMKYITFPSNELIRLKNEYWTRNDFARELLFIGTLRDFNLFNFFRSIWIKRECTARICCPSQVVTLNGNNRFLIIRLSIVNTVIELYTITKRICGRAIKFHKFDMESMMSAIQFNR